MLWRYNVNDVFKMMYLCNVHIPTVRVVEVLGREKALELYKETQKVEREGGLMILVSFLFEVR